MIVMDRVILAILKIMLEDQEPGTAEPEMIATSEFIAQLQMKLAWSNIRKHLETTEVTEEERAKYRKDYHAMLTEQWSSMGAYSIYSLQQLTHFSSEEIKVIAGIISKQGECKSGHNQTEFRKLIETLITHPEMKNRLSFLKRVDLDRLFLMLDDEKKGVLDFR